MALRDSWHRTLVYFGLAEEDDHHYNDHDDYEDDFVEEDEYESRRSRRSREANVRRLPTSRRGRHDDIDDIFSDADPLPSGGGGGRTRSLRSVGSDNGGDDVQVHLVIPRNFNDAQQVADQFKRKVPVILNLQTTDHELSKRLIDFASGLTYALDGGMQRIAEKVFLLTPRNVEVSAEEKARLIDKGFFNQS
ncbi:MAG: cell division protein SepF [Solirubrobacterales bacterium]|nr:cell division protein SepF [Solirubrobacterales bacterium]HMT05971.1 cell division protein SepF [Solirubrobacterales bacterium]